MKTALTVLAFMIGMLSANAQNNFITVWDTSLPSGKINNQAISNDTEIVLPLGNKNYNISWYNTNDPTISGSISNATGNLKISFPIPGVFKISLTCVSSPDVFSFSFGSKPEETDCQKLIEIQQWGAKTKWDNTQYIFNGCSNLDVTATDTPALSRVVNYMFQSCSNLKGNSSFNNWNLSEVTQMVGMFMYAANFNQDLNTWDVSKATNMTNLFANATVFNGNISAWNVSKVTNMSSVFSGAASFNRNLNNWDVSNVTAMANMFKGASAFNGNISSWNVSKVTKMSSMFADAILFNQDIGDWDVSNVTEANNMFLRASGFNQSLGNWILNKAVSAVGFLSKSGMSKDSYEATLSGWAVNLPVADSTTDNAPRTIGVQDLIYGTSAINNRMTVIAKNWSLAGDAPDDVSNKITLPKMLSNNAVLQRNALVKLWGKARPGADVFINASWNTETVTTQAKPDGFFLTHINTPEAGGPYTISFSSDGIATTINNIMIGEVWLCSGQSNMFIKMQGNPATNIYILNAEEIIANANNENLRLMTVLGGGLSSTPIDEIVSGNWKVSTPQSAESFSAVAFQFGQMLQKALNIPVGIVVSAWSGSPVKAWTSTEYLSEFPEMLIDENDKLTGGGPTYLYNTMIHPLKNFKFSGVLWYQGSADIYNHAIYERMLQNLAQNWRETFGVTPEELPFYLTQLHPYFRNGDLSNRNAAYLREAQVKAAYFIPNAGYIVALDAGVEHDNHPPDKTIIAKRFTNLALSETYHVDTVNSKYPEFKKMSIDGSKILLEFKNSEAGIIDHDSLYKGFEVAGKSMIFHPATSARVVNNNEIEVICSLVEAPVALRYAFTNYSDAYIFDGNGMPAPSFRTDNYPNTMAPGEDMTDVMTAWNFNDAKMNPSFGNGSLKLTGGISNEGFVTGIDAGIATVEGVTATNAGKAIITKNYPAQGTAPKTAGIEISVSTEGYKNIRVAADIRHSNGCANTFALQYSVNDVDWIDVHTFKKITAPNRWYLYEFNLSDITAANNRSNLKLRYVTVFDGTSYGASDASKGYDASNDIRYDNIRIYGIETSITGSLETKHENAFKILNNKLLFSVLPSSKIRIFSLTGSLKKEYNPALQIDLNCDKGLYIVVFDDVAAKILVK